MNIFISYARADDKPLVKQLYQDLTEHGFDVWWDMATMQSRGRTFLQELCDTIEGLEPLRPSAVPNGWICVIVSRFMRERKCMKEI